MDVFKSSLTLSKEKILDVDSEVIDFISNLCPIITKNYQETHLTDLWAARQTRQSNLCRYFSLSERGNEKQICKNVCDPPPEPERSPDDIGSY